MKKLLLILLSAVALMAFAQTLPTDEAERAKMARQLTRSIPVELGKIEGTMPQINILIKKGEKMQAKAMVEEALQQIAKIEADQKTLALLDETADDEILMTAEVAEAKRYLIDKANKLRNAIGLYITCDAKLFDKDYPVLLKELQGELSKIGVAFVDSVEQADWVIGIQAAAREYRKNDYGGTSTYFVYVDANIAVDKTATGKRIYEDAITEKGGHTMNFEQAARQAYKDISPKISEIIKQQIQQ